MCGMRWKGHKRCVRCGAGRLTLRFSMATGPPAAPYRCSALSCLRVNNASFVVLLDAAGAVRSRNSRHIISCHVLSSHVMSMSSHVFVPWCGLQIPFEAVDVWVPLCNQDQEGSEVVLFHAGYFTNVRQNTLSCGARLMEHEVRLDKMSSFHPTLASACADQLLLFDQTSLKEGSGFSRNVCLSSRLDSPPPPPIFSFHRTGTLINM